LILVIAKYHISPFSLPFGPNAVEKIFGAEMIYAADIFFKPAWSQCGAEIFSTEQS
jgi:hypothetical protein